MKFTAEFMLLDFVLPEIIRVPSFQQKPTSSCALNQITELLGERLNSSFKSYGCKLQRFDVAYDTIPSDPEFSGTLAFIFEYQTPNGDLLSHKHLLTVSAGSYRPFKLLLDNDYIIKSLATPIFEMLNIKPAEEHKATITGNIVPFPKEESLPEFMERALEAVVESNAEHLAIVSWGSGTKEVMTGYFNCDAIDKFNAASHVQLDAVDMAMRLRHVDWHE